MIVSATPIMSADGVYSGSFAMMADISGRKMADTQRDRMAALLEASPDFVASPIRKPRGSNTSTRVDGGCAGSRMTRTWGPQDRRCASRLDQQILATSSFSGDARRPMGGRGRVPAPGRPRGPGFDGIDGAKSRRWRTRHPLPYRATSLSARAEAELERLKTAIEQAVESIVITDLDGTILYANPVVETTTGYSRKETLGQNPRIFKSGKHDKAFYRELWETISSGRTWKGRLINKRKDGTFTTHEATISPVRNAEGKIVNYVAVERNVSENIRLEEALRQSQKMESVGRLAGGVAHDFNNI